MNKHVDNIIRRITKKMKVKWQKILCVTLAMVMVFGLVAACNQTTADPDATPGPTNNDPSNPDTGTNDPGTGTGRENIFTVAYGAPSTGEFIAGWGNASYDRTIQDLLHGDVATVVIDPFDAIFINPTVVANHTTSDDAEGNRTHVFTIHEDLKWSDGEQITAQDFVAAALWSRSPVLAELGSSTTAYEDIIGVYAYAGGIPEMSEEPDDWDEDEDGEFEPEQTGWVLEPNDYFEGVRLLGDFEFSLTVDGSTLPYFYELTAVSAGPIPLHVWAPGIGVTTDANGSKFDGDITAHAQRVSETERFGPTVVAGPYTFVSFENNIVTVQRNPQFKGDAAGNKPQIEFIQQVEVADPVAVDTLFAGQVDLLPYEIRGANIERVMAEPGFSTHQHLRNGYGLMNFVHNWGPTQDRNVRWAFAHVVDRQAILDQVLEGYGSLIDTEASEAQWMWQGKRGEVLNQIRPIALNIEAAHDFLDQTEWVFEEDGTTAFDRAKANAEGSYLRYNAEGEVLRIRNGAANEEVGGIIEIETVRNAALAGIEFISEFIEWATVLSHLYQMPPIPDEERLYSTFSMGVTFGRPFDPYWSWHSDHYGTWMNPSFSDAEIDELLVTMRRTDSDDLAGYLDSWFQYVVRWNYLLPALPLYANMYVELFNSRVQGVENVTPFADWAHPQVVTQLSLAG